MSLVGYYRVEITDTRDNERRLIGRTRVTSPDGKPRPDLVVMSEVWRIIDKYERETYPNGPREKT